MNFLTGPTITFGVSIASLSLLIVVAAFCTSTSQASDEPVAVRVAEEFRLNQLPGIQSSTVMARMGRRFPQPLDL